MIRSPRRKYLGVLTGVALGGCLSTEELDDGDNGAPNDSERQSDDDSDDSDTDPGTGSSAMDGWPTFRANRRNTGRRSEASGPRDTPSVNWSFETDGDIWGSPAVAEGEVYIPSYDGFCYALDATDGSELWRYEIGDRADSSPAVTEDLVVVGGFDKGVHAINRETGERRWRYDAGGIVRGSPTIYDDTIYIGTHCQYAECVWYDYDIDEDGPGYLVALDSETGEEQWHLETDAGVVSTPAVEETKVYVGSMHGIVYALDRGTGEVEWTFEMEDFVICSPGLIDGTIYISDLAGTVFAIDTTDGTEEWHYEPEPGVKEGSPAIGDEQIFMGSDPSEDGVFVSAFDRANGTKNWSTEINGISIGSSPALVNDRIYIGTHGNRVGESAGALAALSTTGDLLWDLKLEDFEAEGTGFGSSPAIDDGRMVVGAQDNHVYMLE